MTATRKGRVLFVNQHYYPDVAATGQYLADLAEHLAEAGHEVHVLCSNGRYEAGHLIAPAREIRKGVRIRRLATTGFGRAGTTGRLTNYLGFFLQVLFHLLFGRRTDRVVFLTTPPLLALAGLPARLLRGRRYGIWSMDLHPEAETAVGMVRPHGPMHRILNMLARWTYRRADFVVALGPFMAARLEAAGVPNGRIHAIPIWNTDGEVSPLAREDNPLVDALDLADRFVVMYSGNAGLVHRFDEVLQAMVRLQEHPEIFFLFAGNGPQRKRIEAFAREHSLKNFRYLDYFPREHLRNWFNLADVHLLTLINGAAGVAVPSKITGAMASGRPVIMVGPMASEPAEIILQNNMGWVIDPEVEGKSATDRLVEAIERLAGDTNLRTRMGEHSHRAFLREYQRPMLCDRWMDVLGIVGLAARSDVYAAKASGRSRKHWIEYQEA